MLWDSDWRVGVRRGLRDDATGDGIHGCPRVLATRMSDISGARRRRRCGREYRLPGTTPPCADRDLDRGGRAARARRRPHFDAARAVRRRRGHSRSAGRARARRATRTGRSPAGRVLCPEPLDQVMLEPAALLRSRATGPPRDRRMCEHAGLEPELISVVDVRNGCSCTSSSRSRADPLLVAPLVAEHADRRRRSPARLGRRGPQRRQAQVLRPVRVHRAATPSMNSDHWRESIRSTSGQRPCRYSSRRTSAKPVRSSSARSERSL